MKTSKTITRKDEIRYQTSNPKEMLGKFIASKVYRTYEESFILDNGDVTSVERKKLLFDNGIYIDQDLLAQIRFYLQEGSIKQIEVSNQNRKAFVQANSHLYLYKAAAQINDKKHTFLLYATSVKNAIVILTDYIELNYNGGFTIVEVKEFDSIIVLVDELNKVNRHSLDVAYCKEQIDTEEYLNVETEGADDEQPDIDTKFYQITARVVEISSDKSKIELNHTFIIKTINATRANILIENYLHNLQEQNYKKTLEHPEQGVYLKKEIHSFIEESKILPIGRFIPVEFSQVYQDE